MDVVAPDGNGVGLRASNMVVIERQRANRTQPARDASPRCSLHYARVIVRRGFGTWVADSLPKACRGGENRRTAHRGNNLRVKWN